MRSNMSGAGFYNTEPQNFNRSFGRGNSKMFQPPPSPSPSPQLPQTGDLFIDAGRLAVEYLVSHGLLASNTLPGKWSNNSEPQDIRSSQDRELLDSLQTRVSASTRPGAASSDGMFSSQRSASDQDVNGKSLGEKRRNGASRSYSCDWSCENGMEVSLADQVTPSQAMQVDLEKNPKVSTMDGNSDVCVGHSSESVSKDGIPSDLPPETGVHCPVDSDSKIAPSLVSEDDKTPKYDVGANKKTKDDPSNQDNEQEIQKVDSHLQKHEINNDSSTQNKLDFTEDNSSLVIRNLSTDPVKDGSICGDSGSPSLNGIPSSNCLGNALPGQPFNGAGVLDSTYNVNPKKSVEFLLAIDKPSSREEKSIGDSEVQMCSSDPIHRGEKRALEEDCMIDGQKKTKQWFSVADSIECPKLEKLIDKKLISPQERDASTFIDSPNQARLPNGSLPQRGFVEPGINQEERPLFSSSYKICDLNLMEASDMPENPNASSLLYCPVSAPKKETNIDIDLSMSSNFNFTNAYNNAGSVRKDLDVIDLDGSSLEEGKSLETSTRNAEAGITSMGSFANNPQNPSDNPEGQGGYGTMISDFLGNDVSNSSPFQPNMNLLHNGTGLHHGEGIFNEDDPIYMSLGEIPLRD